MKECKGFSLNVPTTNASLTRPPLGSLDLNTRVPNTGTATPQRLRRTEPQRSADLARKRARCAQRTEGQRLHDAHKILTTSNILLYTGYNPWCKLICLCRQPSQKPTTQDVNTHVKLTIVTLLSFSERLAIANLSYRYRWRRHDCVSRRGSTSWCCFRCLFLTFSVLVANPRKLL